VTTPSTHPDKPAIGLLFANGARAAQPDYALALAQAAERQGLESLWAVQHVVVPHAVDSAYPYSADGKMPGGPADIPDPLVWLAWIGSVTTRIRLATGVLVLPQQHPLVVAKQVATLDRLVGGRCILGVGAGWMREEFAALDADFEHRVAVLEESVEVLRRAWSPGPAEMAGKHIRFDPVHVDPKPGRAVPIHLGGHAPAAARRAGRIADGFFPMKVQGEELRRVVTLAREEAERAGRDPAALEITAVAPRAGLETEVQRDLGVHRVMVNPPQVEAHAIADALASRVDRVLAG
jgi:probable F420-dependent oxidoreductase